MTDDRSLLQNTLLRLDSAGAGALVCNGAPLSRIEQAQELGIKDAELILEPHARNTAPAIAAATLRAPCAARNPVMLIMPSDHVLEDGEVLAAAYARFFGAPGRADVRHHPDRCRSAAMVTSRPMRLPPCARPRVRRR